MYNKSEKYKYKHIKLFWPLALDMHEEEEINSTEKEENATAGTPCAHFNHSIIAQGSGEDISIFM